MIMSISKRSRLFAELLRKPGIVRSQGTFWLFLFITFIQLGQVALADEWADGKWNEKLTEPYEKWTSVHDVLVELAQMAGVQDLAFTVECNAPNVVPLRAGLTLKEAFQSAAAMHLLEGQWESGRLTVRKTKKIGDWYAMIGGVSIPIIVEGAKGSLLMPSGEKMKSPAPWIWYAPGGEFAPYHAWLCKRFLDEGISIARVNVDSSGSPKGRAIFTAFYEKITAEHGLARKAVLLPQSRGGLMLYNWAAEHPECVAAIGGIYTVCDLRIYPGLEKAGRDYGMTKDELEAQLAKHNPIDRLEPLAKARIPLFHVHGDKDRTVPLEANSAELVRRYRALGGDAQVLVIPGRGHEVVREYFQCRELADFLIRQANAASGVAAQ